MLQAEIDSTCETIDFFRFAVKQGLDLQVRWAIIRKSSLQSVHFFENLAIYHSLPLLLTPLRINLGVGQYSWPLLLCQNLNTST